MIAKVVVLCLAFAAVSCNLVNTGVSSGSRVMDGHGNYAFEYGIASAGAKRSRSEVGSGHVGPIKTSYSVADSHIAPAAPLALGYGGAGHGGYGGLGYGVGGLGYGGLGYSGLGGLGYGGLGHGGLGGLGYGGLGGLGYGGLGGHGLGLGYGAGLVGARGLGLGYGGHGKLY